MAHFAQLNEDNIVTQVIVVNNSECRVDNSESEEAGIFFCKSIFGEDTNWKQTSYNRKFRKNYAGIGYTYDIEKDAFVPPSPYPSWRLNVDTCLWNPPTEYPADGKLYAWNEESTSWVEVQTDPNSPINK